MFGTYKPMGRVIKEEAPSFTIGIDVGGGEHAWGGKSHAIEAGPLYERTIVVDAKVFIDRLTPSFVARDAVLR